MHISEVRIRAVSIPRIYDTRVAEAGGHAQAKTQSLYYVLELISDTGPLAWAKFPTLSRRGIRPPRYAV